MVKTERSNIRHFAPTSSHYTASIYYRNVSFKHTECNMWNNKNSTLPIRLCFNSLTSNNAIVINFQQLSVRNFTHEPHVLPTTFTVNLHSDEFADWSAIIGTVKLGEIRRGRDKPRNFFPQTNRQRRGWLIKSVSQQSSRLELYIYSYIRGIN